MNNAGKELEVKFYVRDLAAVEKRLQTGGAVQVQPRLHELNLRFDTPKGTLARSFQALRLRQDSQARLTYKGPSQEHEGARLRRELELSVSSFETAKEILEAVGFQVVTLYEKYRAVYSLHPVEVTLDELPYGSFVEIEGPDGDSIAAAARQLELRLEKRVHLSYLNLFERLRKKKNLPFRDLNFENFAGLQVSAELLGVQPAD